jgi:hypothetical protein
MVCILCDDSVHHATVSHTVENRYQEKKNYALLPIKSNRYNNSYQEGSISTRKYNNFLLCSKIGKFLNLGKAVQNKFHDMYGLESKAWK